MLKRESERVESASVRVPDCRDQAREEKSLVRERARGRGVEVWKR